MPNTHIAQVWRIEALYARLEKARELVADGAVSRDPDDTNRFIVQSQTRPGHHYIVTDNCSCSDASIRHELTGLCKHMLARIIEGEGGRP